MGITYRSQGNYFVPNLTLKSVPKGAVGKYGLMRLSYLKENHKATYQSLLVKNKLTHHLTEIDETARLRLDSIIKSLAEKENVNEELKATDQMKWVGLMNNFQNIAEEIVLKELIYL